jgi:hypothetical protein
MWITVDDVGQCGEMWVSVDELWVSMDEMLISVDEIKPTCCW